jgi:ADP-heptose:LPS heptosyltransferase
MKIGVRLEGGLGDHLLANRFVFAIKDKYPNANLYFFSDTEGNTKQANILTTLWPSLYKNKIETLKSRKNHKFFIPSKFTLNGKENYPAHLNNLPDIFWEKLNKFDKFYDLHIDGLKWMRYDFDWLRYFYFFPKPEINIKNPLKDRSKYILCHLFARPDSPYNMEKWYVKQLIEKLNSKFPVLILTDEIGKNYYNNINCEIVSPSNLLDVFGITSGCSTYLGIDSGIRYVPYHFSKPTFVFSKNSNYPFQAQPAHLLRWLLFEKNVLPCHISIDLVLKLMDNIYNHPGSILMPNIDQFADAIVERAL